MSKYMDELPGNYFGFEIFDKIFKIIDDQKHLTHDQFNSGLASADAAVRRLREEYYRNLKQQSTNEQSG